MVATFFELRSSAVAVSYYERDGYYAKNDPEHRQSSFWHGGGAAALGLRAHVRPSRFASVLSGYVPGTDIRLGRMREGENDHRPGWDLTFSAPKSVSLEALVVGDRRVIRAHDDAVRATLDWVETELLETRGWDPATRRRPRVRANGMVVAGFRHLTSRDRDPQLHTHCVLANMTRNAAGDWRSVEPSRLRRNEKLIGAYYRNELARRLQAMGMAVTPRMVGRMPGFELAGYRRSFLDAFSSRRREILSYLERHNLAYTRRNAQIATLRTRRRKEDAGVAELVPAWRAHARALGFSRSAAELAPRRPVDPATRKPVPVPGVPPPDLPANRLRSLRRAPALPHLPRAAAALRGRRTPASGREGLLSPEPEVGVAEAVARAVAHVAERRTAIAQAEIRAVALGHAPGRYRLAEIDAAIERMVTGGELVEAERRGTERYFVTDQAVRAERRVLASMRVGRAAGGPLAREDAIEARLSASRLTRGQKAAVRMVLLGGDRVIGVQGHAGSGKTTMLREVRALLGETPIRGLAPSASAARVLDREAGVPSRTLQYFLTRFADLSDPGLLARGRAEYAGAVLAVDESSMIDTARMDALLRITARLGVARVALVGDTAQLRAVDAGQPFRLLQKAGMATATMDEVLRQRDPELLAAVGNAREGAAGAAIEGLGRRVREVSREALGAEAARQWLALAPGERADTLLLAPTHEIRRRTNEAVREGLAREGRLHGRTLGIDRLVNRRLTRAQASEIASYEPGDTVVFHRDVFGCRSNDVCIVTGHEDGTVVLAHPDGGERRFRPSGNAAGYLGLYDTERIDLRAGDRIRWTRNRKATVPRFGHPPAPALVNGGEAEIVGIDAKRVRFRDGDREFGLPRGDPQLRHLDHAYSNTVHAAQGRTARGAIAVLDASPTADMELFHVELSRVTDSFLLLTDDREALIEGLEARGPGEDGALEALGIDPAAEPAVDPAAFAALARDWRALTDRAEAAGTGAASLPGYREIMERADALAERGDLPVDMRRLVDAMLDAHEAHLAREREVLSLIDRIRQAWRRRPELGWAARARGCPVDEVAGHAAWREEGAGLVAAGRAMLAGAGGIRRHLRAGIEGAVLALERTRMLDDGDRFARLWPQLRAGAARTRIPEALVDGYAEVAELARRLAPAAGLDAGIRAALADWQETHAAQTALADEVRTLPGRIAAWEQRLAALPRDRHGGADPQDTARLTLRRDGERLERVAAAMLRPDAAHAPWIEAAPGTSDGIGQAAGAVRAALARDRYAGLAWLAGRLGQGQRETGALAFHHPRCGEMIDLARSLAAAPALSGDQRQFIEKCLAWHRENERLAAGVRDWPGRAEALLAEHPGPSAGVDGLADWCGRAVVLLEEAAAMRASDSPHAPHLDAMPRESAAIRAAMLRLDAGLVEAGRREIRRLAILAREQAGVGAGSVFDTPAHRAMIGRARALDACESVAAETRTLLRELLDQDRGWRGQRERIRAFLDAAAAFDRVQAARAAETGPVPLEEVVAREVWRDALRIAEEAGAIGAGIAGEDLAAHLAALGGAPDAVEAIGTAMRRRAAEDESCARLMERVLRNRADAGRRGIAEFATEAWHGIVADVRDMIVKGHLSPIDSDRLSSVLGRDALRRIAGRDHRIRPDGPDLSVRAPGPGRRMTM
ncbi:MAG: relaxase domain-containing protein [Alphaproteobacteria bacterium]|nr:relaxase domain-containing protein [Alphaproteobacteria bacterium]